MIRPGDGPRLGAFIAAFFAAASILSAYLPLWLADRGMGAAWIGTVLGVAALLRVAAVPAWGWAADRLGQHRVSLLVAALVATAAAASLPGAANAGIIALLVILGGIAASALAPLADALTLALAAAGRLDYGRTRAWGSVAFMAAAALGGVLLDRAGTFLVPWLLTIFYGLAALFTAFMPQPDRSPSHRSLKPGPLGAAFRWTLLATALTQGSHAGYYGFASLYWRGAGISDTIIGLLIAEGIVAEVALFVWGRRLIEWLGPSRLTAFSALACLVRWTATALTVSVPLLAAVQLLHAGSFACQHLSAMLVLRALPAQRAGFAQTLLAALGFSAPTGAMIWLAGGLYAANGAGVFFLMAAVGGAALIVAPFLPAGVRRRSA